MSNNLEECPLCREHSKLVDTSDGPMCIKCLVFQLKNFPSSLVEDEDDQQEHCETKAIL